MLRYVSHELRTPLSILLTGLELLEGIVKDGGSTEEVVSTIEDLKQPCRTSVSILNDLLAYEKLDAGIMQLEKIVQDVDDTGKTVIRTIPGRFVVFQLIEIADVLM